MEYADLGDLSENQRIAIIGEAAALGKVIGFIVDDEPKADRYLSKLIAGYRVRLIDRCPGPAGTVLVRIGPQES